MSAQQLNPSPVFARESVDEVGDAIQALTLEHYAETSHPLGKPPLIDLAKYAHAEKVGVLRIYTVRVGELVGYPRVAGHLVGYQVFTVAHSWHHQNTLQARMDTLFIHPDYRLGSTGYRFLKWCLEQLDLEGVEVSYQHDKILPDGRLDLGPLFHRLGYQEIYRVYWRAHGV